MVRPNSEAISQSEAEFDNADDALAAAFRLDMDGDWEAAIALYAKAAEEWPEQSLYARECIKRIEEKQSHT
jgi:hypothetical protein